MCLPEAHASEDFKAMIEVDYESIKRDINPLLYGSNSLFLFDGQESPVRFKKDNGIWSKRDNDINKHARDLLVDSGITILRYPVGDAGEYYYWGWSIAPFKKRLKTVLRTVWDRPEHYTFGTLEFIKLCKAIKSKGIININYAMRNSEFFYDAGENNDPRSKREIAIQQAANWVEFMNIDAPPEKDPAFPQEYKPEYSLHKMPKGYFAWLRASMGHPDPFVIKYWEIGNELNKFFKVEEYVEDAIRFSRAMKAVDPTIKIGWVEFFGKHFGNYLEKELKLASQYSEDVDFLISHDYIKANTPDDLEKSRVPLWNSRPVKRQVTVSKDGQYSVTLKAFARIYFGDKFPSQRAIPPRLELYIDNRFISEIVIDKNLKKDKSDIRVKWPSYKVPVHLSPGSHTISLKLLNFFIDKSFPDTNRRTRMVFLNSWLIEGQGEKHEIVFPPKVNKPELPEPYRYYSLLNDFEKNVSYKQTSISKFAPHLFIAQTESGYSFAQYSLWGALGDAAMLMTDMKLGIKIRNLHHLFGPCYRKTSIHSGKNEDKDTKENYHVDPEYFANKMFSQHFGSKMLSCNIRFPESQSNENVYINKKLSFTMRDSLRAVASRDRDKLYIAMINFHSDKKALVELKLHNFQAKKSFQYTLRAKNPKDFNATNEKDKDNVFIQTSSGNIPANSVTLLPNSFTILELIKNNH